MGSDTYNKLNLLAEWDRYSKMTISEMKKCLKKACAVGGKIVKDETKKELKAVLPAAWHRNKKYNDRLVDGIRIGIFTSKTKDQAKVHIMGKRTKGSGTFRLRFFENGTFKSKNRDKDGHNRGSITALNFFDKASRKSYGPAKAVIEQIVSGTLNKINSMR